MPNIPKQMVDSMWGWIKEFNRPPFTSLVDHISFVFIPSNHLYMAGLANFVLVELISSQWLLKHLFLTFWPWRSHVFTLWIIVIKANALRRSQSAKKWDSFEICLSLSSGIGWQEPWRIIYMSEWKSCFSNLGWQIKKRDSTYSFLSPQRGRMGILFWWSMQRVMQWVNIFHLLKRNYFVVILIAQLWLASMRTISCVK